MNSTDTNYPNENKAKNSLPTIVIKSIMHGILGFFGFLAVLLVTKYIGYLIGSISSFKVETEDLLLCSIGFIFSFLIKILSSYQEDVDKE